MEQKNKTPLLCLVVIFLGLCLQLPFQTINNLPVHQRVTVGERLNLNLSLPKFLAPHCRYTVDGMQPSNFGLNDITPVAATPGRLDVQIKLFGFIPVRHLTVSVVPEIRVIPGGQAIGVMVESEGVMVVGRSVIIDRQGRRHNPAAAAGIELGDVLLKVNGIKVETESQVRDLINNLGQAGKPLQMELKRRQSRVTYRTTVKPIYCQETKRYRIGLYVRDGTAGVGTMTFYEPRTKSYGALGHIISDLDTCQPIELGRGKVMGARIEGIRMGKKGLPGEKMGVFRGDADLSGNIIKNTNCGIFGKLTQEPKNIYRKDALPVAMAHEIKEGPAEIYTVVQGEQIEKFNIEIQQVHPQGRSEGKGMIIKITDPQLLRKTGGIVQGMSGSPIIQEGKLVGAVTHVFVNDPARGYGVLAEWMLDDSGILPEQVSKRNVEKMTILALKLGYSLKI
ncbi:SpoIVB peptidase [Desulforamulus hydrothermalis]|uniref:SpoIVB peptidase n=1 Tax=Desulforamulus hydrothermalis Lam5 = DSM 18033 TaxID=1121428 RepID=K8E089_9FIRM|nr:SpoIVB peptidase [Desulforamulus hydrothermalis]CCO08934.1 SpoIVB peptidase [Desulforamulus hydrothermalis Lam5 = DSM 18033]SHG75133.1 stage IV sporulation protein B [Desulforamulus hydrothermalis Lam5 = DSM 18033]